MVNWFPLILGLVFAGVFAFASVQMAIMGWRHATGWRKPASLLGGTLVLLGSFGFFSQLISASGGFDWLGPTFEWPMGWTTDVITTPEGRHIAWKDSCARIQVYDQEWNFLRGWRVEPGNGFRAMVTGPDRLLVVTSKNSQRIEYDFSGNRLYARTASRDEYNAIMTTGESRFIATNPLLLGFSHPFLGWLIGLCGGILMGLSSKTRRKSCPLSTPSTHTTTP